MPVRGESHLLCPGTGVSMNDHNQFWIGFNLVKGIGPTRVRELIETFGDVRSAWLADPDQLRAAGLNGKLIQRLQAVRREFDWDKMSDQISREGITILTWEDPAYPDQLREIPQSPPVLYVRGRIREEDHQAVAVVGTRRLTSYGRQAAEEIARFLARRGITVVSGLARGIDGIAHRTALEAGGRTLAVLGSGLDRVYPPEHRSLARDICQEGAVVSDYPLGTPPDGSNFPPRNRIVSGLAKIVVVIEAGRKSGALITANYAADQGRDVFAVPGKIYAPKSKGTNFLLKQGAHPLTAPEDILDVLEITADGQPEAVQLPLPSNPTEEEVFEVLGLEALHVDEISSRAGLPIEAVTAALTMMEIKGMVLKSGSMMYRKAAG